MSQKTALLHDRQHVSRQYGFLPVADGAGQALVVAMAYYIELGSHLTRSEVTFGRWISRSLARRPAFVAEQLEPVLGSLASAFFGLGLFAAGLTSAITAPLAAAYATSGALGWKRDLKAGSFRLVWGLVIVTGLGFALSGGSPSEVIVLAQAANGLLLPLIAVFLLLVVNDGRLMGEHRNGPLANALGAAVVLVVSGLGLYQLLRVFGIVT